MNAAIHNKVRAIKLLILDVDGVLTDGKLYYSGEGETLKAFHVHDGAGIKRLLAQGIAVAAITARKSAIVTKRLTELGVAHIYQAQADKSEAFIQLCEQLKLSPHEVAYIGDDVADLPAMKLAGFSIAVANAFSLVKVEADYQTELRGGEGAVREICELILSAQS